MVPLIHLESQAAGSEVTVRIEVQILLPAGFWYLQILQRKAGMSILPRVRLSLSSAFEGLHPTVQKAAPRTARKTKSKDHFEGRSSKDHTFKGRFLKVKNGRKVESKGTSKRWNNFGHTFHSTVNLSRSGQSKDASRINANFNFP